MRADKEQEMQSTKRLHRPLATSFGSAHASATIELEHHLHRVHHPLDVAHGLDGQRLFDGQHPLDGHGVLDGQRLLDHARRGLAQCFAT
jgi:hypothetical protein